MDYMDYLYYRRDAFIYKMQQTKEGEEYLENAYRLTLTEPNRQKLREKMEK